MGQKSQQFEFHVQNPSQGDSKPLPVPFPPPPPKPETKQQVNPTFSAWMPSGSCPKAAPMTQPPMQVIPQNIGNPQFLHNFQAPAGANVENWEQEPQRPEGTAKHVWEIEEHKVVASLIRSPGYFYSTSPRTRLNATTTNPRM